MRSKASIRNAIVAVITNILTVLIGFVAQKIFSVTLGQEYLGINGLFSNIVSMLGIVELGIGSAIIYHLYKPLADNNKEKIKSLMVFYKKAYRIIAIIILFIGVAIVPFLSKIVGEVNILDNIYIIYFLFIIDTIMSYLLTYKRSILYANQQTYIINSVHLAYLIVMNTLQAIFLFTTKNYICYLIIKIACRILENLILTCIVNKKYPYINEKAKTLDLETKNDIKKKIKALFLHKIGEFIIKSTDNIVISSFLGIITVGIYSGYSMIINALNLLIQQVYDSITASIGNLLVENNEDKTLKTYKELELLNFWIAAFMSISFYCIVTPFVRVWLGNDYLLSNGVVITLAINLYLQGVRKNINAFKVARGIFYEDRFMPILEVIIKLTFSVMLVNIIGLPGVFLGTIISALFLHTYAYPKYVYKAIFKRKRIEYIYKTLGYFVIALLTAILTAMLTQLVVVNNDFIQIIINAVICIIIPNMIFVILFHKKDEYIFFKNIIKNIFKKRLKKDNM